MFLNERQSAMLESKAQRLKRAVERARSQFAAKSSRYSSSTSYSNGSRYLDQLPLELLIGIFSYCSLSDIVHLRLCCRNFNNLITLHESPIVSSLITKSRPSLSLLSHLFPPPKQANVRKPTLHYLHSLQQRHVTSATLAHHLAEAAVGPLFSIKPRNTISSSTSLNAGSSERAAAIATLEAHLITQLYHVDHFLTHSRLQLSAVITRLLASNSASPTHQLLSSTYREVQAALISRWPDSALISTHHAFHFLVNTIRLKISPDPPHNTNDETVCTMLRCTAPLRRFNEFFMADTPSAPGRLRRQFMTDMQVEKEKAGWMVDFVFGGIAGTDPSMGNGARAGGRRRSTMHREREPTWSPRVGEVWFEVARAELKKRGLEKHEPDGRFRWQQGEVVVGCPECRL
ncbi:hypothetical protein BZA77DRAFT_53890 [Pyronema omphalodes]|nr:hypothetical protein BZA77DRAFT_53890 [Pyronema omphalodes]